MTDAVPNPEYIERLVKSFFIVKVAVSPLEPGDALTLLVSQALDLMRHHEPSIEFERAREILCRQAEVSFHANERVRDPTVRAHLEAMLERSGLSATEIN